jgi:uncharacterized membrane protein YgaE (UPF0421/DUF939 family)
LGSPAAGPNRLEDVVIGAGVGLLFRQILLTPDPVRLVNEAASGMLEVLGRGFELDAEALAKRDPQKAKQALNQFMTAHASLDILGARITSATAIARWSLRGRFAARKVMDLRERYDRRMIHLYAATVLFGVAVDHSLRQEEEPPIGLKTGWIASSASAKRWQADLMETFMTPTSATQKNQLGVLGGQAWSIAHSLRDIACPSAKTDIAHTDA